MASISIRRLADSCVIVDDGDQAVLIDPGTYTWQDPSFSIDDVVWLDRILITHSHADHCDPEFVVALKTKFPDVPVQSNSAVAGQLASHGVDVTTDSASWVDAEDAPHEAIPLGEPPPNTAFHVSSAFTHPGDSRRLTSSAPVLAVPMMPPWGSMTGAIRWINALRPSYVLPIHDWNLNDTGKGFVSRIARQSLDEGIELLDLGAFEETDLEL